TPTLRSGFEKSLELFQAIAPSACSLRPHCEGALVRIPTSIPDDEMLYDRLRITDQRKLGDIWCEVLRHVYALGGIYTLNLHPERGVLCKPALNHLLAESQQQPLPVWLASLREVDTWWRERKDFTLAIESAGEGLWRIAATCTPRATVLARHITLDDTSVSAWYGPDVVVESRQFTAHADRCPCIALSTETPGEVEDFLHEQGYPTQRVAAGDATVYALFVDEPEGLGETRPQQIERRSALVAQIEALEAPLVRFGVWPDRARSALAVTGDIDSITVQDFFLRILEARQYA
ncbi:MAG: hypothetical protein ABI068_01290, partial [Ktedonobacterales bacterium]